VTFAVGDEIRVADRQHAGHHRTPGYLKGKRGTIARVHRSFRNPETRAYGEDGQPPLRLYLVEFAHDELWPTSARHRDRVCADLFEHWLEAAS
jgi:nitrile hydratase subunit beta